MKNAELRERSLQDLAELEDELNQTLWKARFQNFTNQLDDTAKLSRIRRELAETALPDTVEVAAAADLSHAVEAAFAWARPSGVVLLSPAAPRFGVYRDYRATAAASADAVRALDSDVV